ncbi:MAG: ATP-binding protein [Ginsengibacter sp.]
MDYRSLKKRIKVKPLRTIYIFYWFLLSYIIAALLFWYISLATQNKEITVFKENNVEVNDPLREQKLLKIQDEKRRKTAQYAGEGITFLLFIIAGAVFVFRLVNRQLVLSQQQQNFMMAITHELKTPIAVTKLNLETMRKRQLEPEQQQKILTSTIQETNRLNSLCNNMLLLSQFDSGGYTLTRERFDAAELIRETVDDFAERFQLRNFRLVLKDQIFINGDKVLLQMALNNLIDNALKYSGKNETVTLKLFKDDKYIRLQVIDEGNGIPDEEKKKIFEKYFRGAKRQAKGTGLGLYLTKRIVKQHQGTIQVLDNTPQGCIFEMVFKESKVSHS